MTKRQEDKKTKRHPNQKIKRQHDRKTTWQNDVVTKRRKGEKTKRPKRLKDKKTKDIDQKESLILWRQGSFALLRCCLRKGRKYSNIWQRKVYKEKFLQKCSRYHVKWSSNQMWKTKRIIPNDAKICRKKKLKNLIFDRHTPTQSSICSLFELKVEIVKEVRRSNSYTELIKIHLTGREVPLSWRPSTPLPLSVETSWQ